MRYQDEVLTLGEVLTALDEEWTQVVRHHFRKNGVTREPSASEKVTFYVVSRKRKDDYHQRSLFE